MKKLHYEKKKKKKSLPIFQAQDLHRRRTERNRNYHLAPDTSLELYPDDSDYVLLKSFPSKLSLVRLLPLHYVVPVEMNKKKKKS